MLKSMTGYGRGEYIDAKKSITVEIKAVNHRYCEIYVKMPRRYSFAEERIKTEIKDVLNRGKIEVSVTVDNFGESESDIRFNGELAAKYYDALNALGSEFDFDGGKNISLRLLATMPDVIKSVPAKEDEEAFTKALTIATEMALQEITNMRATEGEKLAADISMRVDLIEDIKDKIAARAPEISKEYMLKIKERIDELLDGKVDIPEDRILLEAAIFADKANVTEELIRLGSHIDQLRNFIATADDAVGKKIDFLVQEMNREANTIGSKSNDTEITGYMLELKAEIEKIREQVQNIE